MACCLQYYKDSSKYGKYDDKYSKYEDKYSKYGKAEDKYSKYDDKYGKYEDKYSKDSYKAPEVSNSDRRADMWSLGCTANAACFHVHSLWQPPQKCQGLMGNRASMLVQCPPRKQVQHHLSTHPSLTMFVLLLVNAVLQG